MARVAADLPGYADAGQGGAPGLGVGQPRLSGLARFTAPYHTRRAVGHALLGAHADPLRFIGAYNRMFVPNSRIQVIASLPVPLWRPAPRSGRLDDGVPARPRHVNVNPLFFSPLFSPFALCRFDLLCCSAFFLFVQLGSRRSR